MSIQKPIKQAVLQLTGLLEQLTDHQYTRPSKALSNATIGQHMRHIIELYLCLEKGYETGVVNYEQRKRDRRIEQERHFAYDLLVHVYQSVNKPDKILILQANYDESSEETIMIGTNYNRELLYNLEHTIHHMALMKVAVNEVSSVQLPESFGISSSTIKYKNHVHSKFYSGEG